MATKPNTTKKPATKQDIDAVRHKAEAIEARTARVEANLQRLKTATTQNPVGKQVSGFVTFLREQSVVGLAIGLVLGTQAKALVDQLIASFINPLVGLLLPGEGSLQQKVFTVTFDGKTQKFGWGAFVLSMLTFIVVAAVVYYVFRGLGLDKLDKKKDDK